MTKNQSSPNSIKRNISVSKTNKNQTDQSPSIQIMTEEFKKKILSLSYEESLKALDELLELALSLTSSLGDHGKCSDVHGIVIFLGALRIQTTQCLLSLAHCNDLLPDGREACQP